MFTTVAFFESLDPAGAFVNIAGVADDHVRVDGDLIRVPPELPNLAGVGALFDAPVITPAARIESPSLRAVHNYETNLIEQALPFGDPPVFHSFARNPIPLAGDESIDALALSNPAVPEQHFVIALFSDGPPTPVEGPIYAVRATGQNVGAAGVWTTSTLTFDDELPVGRWSIVGLRVIAATGIFARFVFVGGIWRPGAPIVADADTPDVPDFRKGMLGVWGTFHTNQPPQLEILDAAGGVPDVILDVIPAAA